MNEEAITWNLRGPKRMRKRRELNALLKNNHKYRSMFKHNSSIDMFNLNSGASRLLNKSNDSSTDNDEFYFSANKSVIREKKEKKLLQNYSNDSGRLRDHIRPDRWRHTHVLLLEI